MGSSAEEVNGDGMVIKRRSVRQLAAMLATLIIAARAPACLCGDSPDSGTAVP